MPERIVPMVHVPNVAATAEWYASIGFKIREIARESGDDGEVVWASLTLGGSEIMLNAGGKSSSASRRDFDLYIHTENIDQVRSAIGEHVDMVEDLHDTFYGMREFIIRDCNGFWITFGQPVKG